MSDCRYGVSPVNYPDPDPDLIVSVSDHCFSFYFLYINNKLSCLV